MRAYPLTPVVPQRGNEGTYLAGILRTSLTFPWAQMSIMKLLGSFPLMMISNVAEAGHAGSGIACEEPLDQSRPLFVTKEDPVLGVRSKDVEVHDGFGSLRLRTDCTRQSSPLQVPPSHAHTHAVWMHGKVAGYEALE